jgi:hypothetical protein
MLQELEAPSAEQQSRALLGLRELLRVRPREVLAYLLPRRPRPPVSASYARMLEVVAEATGPTLHYHVSTPHTLRCIVSGIGSRSRANVAYVCAIESSSPPPCRPRMPACSRWWPKPPGPRSTIM